MSPLIKNLLFALGLATIVWLGYTIFIKDSELGLTASNSLVTSQAILDAQEFLAKLQQLRVIELDDKLFSDPRFRSLVDHRQVIVDEPVGRSNPFSPVFGE